MFAFNFSDCTIAFGTPGADQVLVEGPGISVNRSSATFPGRRMNGRGRERESERKRGRREKEGARTPCQREGKTDARSKRECLHSRSPDYTKGIFQSIGFKEFHAYLILSEKERASEKVSSERKMDRRYELRSRSRDCRSPRHGSCFRLGSRGYFSAVKMHRATCNVPRGRIAVSLPAVLRRFYSFRCTVLSRPYVVAFYELL